MHPLTFLKNLIWFIYMRDGEEKDLLFFLLLMLNHSAKKSANVEVCWVGLSTDYVTIDSNSHKSLESFLE